MVTVLTEMDDLALIRRYLEQDDRTALGALFERHANLAYRMAYRVMRHPGDAEDAVQAAFVQAMRALPRYRGGEGFRVWLAKVVIGTCKKKIRESVRRRNREEQSSKEQETVAVNEENPRGRVAELTDAVLAELDKLPDLYRLPIWLHYYENLPFQDVAAALASSENTVKSQARRGLAMLRDSLGVAGFSVSLASIESALPLLPADPAPASVLRGIRAEIQNLAVPGRAPVAGLRLIAGAAVAAAAIVAVGVALWPGPGEGRAGGEKPGDDAALSPAHSAPGFSWSCDFNLPSSTGVVKAVKGSFRYLPDGGPDGSGCIETEDERTLLDIQVPVEALPVLVTYRRAGMLPVPEDGFTSLVCWRQFDSGAQFRGIGQAHSETRALQGKVLPWRLSREYVAEDFIDRWAEQQRVDFMAVRRAPGSRLQLILRGRHRLDDLSIRSVGTNELPDVSPYQEALRRIPPEKRIGQVPLPELKPGAGRKAVSVMFLKPLPQ